jgi:hydrogenase expression/formation protein HypC
MRIGEYAIVHAGFAITRLDEASANDTLTMFENLGLLEEELAGTEGQSRTQSRKDPA